jgi:hypothetical protein
MIALIQADAWPDWFVWTGLCIVLLVLASPVALLLFLSQKKTKRVMRKGSSSISGKISN